ncbi:interleukin-6 receptor subunit beta isoform X2 [Triplophysa rosa]|uniref:interleukin-6 receptor subunit beta isoform X2 n=1 Tax=Triplophysa rosa TaxID=992332 RepID=UPI002545F2A7|nr:interleukin-6 receptor subunit beta isoform X2 [Triplophysa rosa]
MSGRQRSSLGVSRWTGKCVTTSLTTRNPTGGFKWSTPHITRELSVIMPQTRSQTIQTYPEDRLELCDLYPGSRYAVKLRTQDSRASTHWSSWSSKDFTTVEKAPSHAPRLWRRIRPVEETRWRRLTLHWKPLSWPEANGIVLSYTAWCLSDVDSSQWTCGALDASKTSCDLTVSDDACTCSLTATNSAGTSPVSHINIPGHTDAELPPPESISVISLDDTRLRLEWTTAPNQSESGFVVQWISILDNGTTRLHWQHLNETSRRFIVTGLLPEIPYNVSVMRVYGAKAGIDMSVVAFTREGAPSFGPKLTVLQTGGRSIHLRWDPVPIEKLHGFIKFYSILYSINGKDKREQVNSAVDQISLNGLMEGTYNICVMAHTVAGGAAGPWQMVALGYDDIQVIPMLLCALLLIFIFLIIPVCMWVRIKQCLCPIVPNPSNSSLSVWSKPSQHKRTPSSTLSSFFSTGQTSCNHGYDEKDNGPVQVLNFHPVQQIRVDIEAKANTYNCTSAKTPKLRTDESTHFQADLTNQSFTKPNQIMSAGYQDDYLSPTDPFIDRVPSYQSDPTAREDLCDYIHVSQCYMSVMMVDAYRTLNADECSHVLRGLPEDHGI